MGKMNLPRQKEEEEECKVPQDRAKADADADSGFFEFFNTDHIAGAGAADQMSAAEDIFHSWRRLQALQQHATESRNQNGSTKASADHDHAISLLKRAASLNNSPMQQKQQHMDITLRMPRRADSARILKLDSSKTMNPSSLTSSSRPNPKWYLLMFGSMKKKAGEIDMRDIRRRQNERRNIPLPTPPPPASKSRRKLLLRGFSCKEDHATAVAKVSIGCIPQV